MAKQTVKKSSNAKSTKSAKCDFHPSFFTGIVVMLAIAAAVCIGELAYLTMQQKTYEEQEYLGVYPHLLSRYVEYMCNQADANRHAMQEENNEPVDTLVRICQMTDYGVSNNGDPYVTYIEITSDSKTHEQVGDSQELTYYFQHRDHGGYADALGKPEN